MYCALLASQFCSDCLRFQHKIISISWLVLLLDWSLLIYSIIHYDLPFISSLCVSVFVQIAHRMNKTPSQVPSSQDWVARPAFYFEGVGRMLLRVTAPPWLSSVEGGGLEGGSSCRRISIQPRHIGGFALPGTGRHKRCAWRRLLKQHDAEKRFPKS